MSYYGSDKRGDAIRALVAAFKERYRRWSQTEVAERVDGVTQKDLSRWRRDDYRPEHMTYEKERALLDEMRKDPPKRRR